ncbi:MAG: hypothetical protein JSS59_10705 [Proteobacteria bacterium]|uniref:hypothetical protein n=1 Tax=Rudaea sp. TaxID=2136325 RepID=UPI003784FECF|nr:hypothetical protein [Pseudomonadota bacterium]
MIRRLVLLPILFVIWLALFAWAADVPWSAPWTAAARLSVSPREFHVQFGEASTEPQGLLVRAFDSNGMGLQTESLARVRAEQYPILRYRIVGFPHTLELALVFRRSDSPQDVQTISLPTPGKGEIAVDLSRFAEWRGEITELGFAQYAGGQLVPPSVAAVFKPFRIEQVQLQSSSWSDVLPRLRSDWFGYRPWALYSISALGPQIATSSPSWMQPVLVLGVGLSLAVSWIALRWPRRRLARVAIVAAAIVWLLLDLRWLDDLLAKHAVTEEVYAGRPWAERVALQPDEATLAATRQIAGIAAEMHAGRVLVHADSPYTMLRMIYFLLPLNVAPLQLALSEAPATPLPRDALIAVFDSEWKYDENSRRLGNDTTGISVEPLYASKGLRIFRVDGRAP